MIVCATPTSSAPRTPPSTTRCRTPGQTCISIERVLRRGAGLRRVRPEGHREGARAAAGRARGARDGRGRRDDLPAADGHRRGARRRRRRQGRASVLTRRPRRDGRRRFFEPTVLVDVDHTMEIMTEETFGPTLPIMKVATPRRRVRLANDSPYGLGASVFTKDLEKGEQIARRIDAGSVCVNDAIDQLRRAELPMGGARPRASGRGTAPTGSASSRSPQTILITRSFPKRDLHMFPYTAAHRRWAAVQGAVRPRQARLGRVAFRARASVVARVRRSSCAGACDRPPADRTELPSHDAAHPVARRRGHRARSLRRAQVGAARWCARSGCRTTASCPEPPPVRTTTTTAPPPPPPARADVSTAAG